MEIEEYQPSVQELLKRHLFHEMSQKYGDPICAFGAMRFLIYHPVNSLLVCTVEVSDDTIMVSECVQHGFQAVQVERNFDLGKPDCIETVISLIEALVYGHDTV